MSHEFNGLDLSVEAEPCLRIWATHPLRGASLVRDLRPERLSLECELLASGRIEGLVHGVRGAPLVVLARRVDEPDGARRQTVRKTGEFLFADLPAGNYEVSLCLPRFVNASVANVSVVAGQTVFVELAILTSTVRLMVNVPQGYGRVLVLASADDDTPEPEPSLPRIIVREPRISVAGRRLEARRSMESVTFDFLRPGKYRASINGETWTTLVVEATPELQIVNIG